MLPRPVRALLAACLLGACPKSPVETTDAGPCGGHCSAGQACVKEMCFERTCGSIRCAPSEVCTEPRCVAQSCIGVTCGAMELCADGVCLPTACGPTACGLDEVCVNNACEPRRCAGVSCPGAQICANGQCYDAACGGLICPMGQVCLDGACGDRACAGLLCPSNMRCALGVCVAIEQPGQLGDSCDAGAQCESSFCANSVCCDRTCNGMCESCLTGTCVTLDAGSCAALKSNGQSCQTGGECVSGQCAGSVCCDRACGGACESCSTGTCTAFAAGNMGSPSCAPYLCPGDAGTCPTSCGTVASCVPGATCTGNACVVPRANGQPCTGSAQCSSAQCADGVCCDSACSSPCDRCNLSASLGMCTTAPAMTAGSPSCGPFLCNGTSVLCPTTCLGAADCETGSACSGGGPNKRCQPYLPLASPCANDGQCTSNRCADGVCCNTPCSGTCDACNLPGQVGTCAILDAGAPVCANNQVCSGRGANCPCSSLTDDFNGAALDGTKWSFWGGNATAAQAGGELQITVPGGFTGIAYNGLNSAQHYDLTGCATKLNLTRTGLITAGNYMELVFQVAIDANNLVGIYVTFGGVLVVHIIGGTRVDNNRGGFNPSTMKWFRIRESGGNTTYEWSTDGNAWTTLLTEPNPIAYTNVYFSVGAGSYLPAPSTSVIAFDNFNVP